MTYLQRAWFLGIAVGVGCGGDAAPEAVGDCVELEAYPGYVTCVLNAPQADGAAASARLAAVTDDDLPAMVELVRPFADSGCFTVHSQRGTGWCTLNATTAALEAASCAGGAGGGRLSEPHLRYEWNQHRNFTAADITVGMWIADAVAVVDNAYLAGDPVWPAVTTGTPAAMATAMNDTRPLDDALACAGRARATGDVAIAAGDVAAARRALATGNPVIMSFQLYNGTGWTAGAEGFPPAGTNIVSPDPRPATSCRCSCAPGEAGCTACATDAHCTIGWHTVLLTGYDDAAQRFTFVNSWSDGWSRGGFATMTYDYLRTSSQGGAYLTGLAPPPPPCTHDECDGVDAFYDQLLTWECGRVMDCCSSEDVPDGFTFDVCKAQMADAVAPMIAAMDAAIDGSTLGYDCGARDGCLAGFAALTCEDFSRMWASGELPVASTAACAALLTPHVVDGGDCTIDVECTSRRCGVETFGEPGHCRPAPTAGQSCHVGAEFVACADGLYCAGLEQICTPRGANGASCGASYECTSGYCACPPGGCLPADGSCADPVACDGA